MTPRDRAAVTVPATSANLGPGFDCLGLALDLRDRLEAEVLEAGQVPGDLEVIVSGEGADELPLDESHLVVRCMRAVLERFEVEVPGLRLRCTNSIPQSRGMGSSSAAIVGGLGLARALVPDGENVLSDADLLAMANAIEGHPDNVAPALLGGLVVSGVADDDVWAVRAPVCSDVVTVALVPPYGVRTEVARGLLPATVAHADAAANTGRAALLVTALGNDPALLWRATEDFLHQRYREPAMPESLQLVRTLRVAGLPALISGAGPTVLVLCAGAAEVDAARAATPAGWRCLSGPVEDAGLLTVPTSPPGT